MPNDYEISIVLDRDIKKICSNNKMCKHLLVITDTSLFTRDKGDPMNIYVMLHINPTFM